MAQDNTQLTRCCEPKECCIEPRDAVAYARLFKALSDPTRIEMLGILSACLGTKNVCDLESCFDLSQPTISHHLKILREAGLVQTERRGQCRCYSLADGWLDALSTFRAQFA